MTWKAIISFSVGIEVFTSTCLYHIHLPLSKHIISPFCAESYAARSAVDKDQTYHLLDPA